VDFVMPEAVNRILGKFFSTKSGKKSLFAASKNIPQLCCCKNPAKAFYYLVLLFYFSMQDHNMEKKFIFR
jgi:hypothetical protein